VERGLGRGKHIAVDVKELHVCRHSHWVYHRDNTAGDFDPIPSKSGIAIPG
jgi:hypothetical protein